jgi:hypothetical protein
MPGLPGCVKTQPLQIRVEYFPPIHSNQAKIARMHMAPRPTENTILFWKRDDEFSHSLLRPA